MISDQLSLELAGFPTAIRPMRASVAEAPFSSPEYLFEVRWDGLRGILARDTKGVVRLQGRNLEDLGHLFPDVLLAGERLTPGTAVDGVMVVTDTEGRPNPAQLRQWLDGGPGDGTGAFLAFDLLFSAGRPLLRQPLLRRRARLRRDVASGGPLVVPDHVETEGTELFEACLEQGLPGIVAKHRESPYVPGQTSPLWLSVSAAKTDDFVVVGWTPGSPFSALVVAYHELGRLLPAGSVGGGFTPQEAIDLGHRLAELATADCPLSPPPIVTGSVQWCRPELVVRLRYSEWAADGTIRFPIFERLQPSVNPFDCVRHRPRVVIEGRARTGTIPHSLARFPF